MDERNERRRKLSEQEKKNLDRQQRKEREIQQKKARRDAKYREQARAEARKKGMDSHIVVEIPAQPVKRKKKPKKKTLPDIIEKETDKKVRDLDPTDHKDGYYVNEVGVRKATAEKQKKRRKKAQPKPVSPKQRRRRRIIAYASIFTAVMIIGVVLSMTVLFKTEHIEVKGNKYYEDSMIIDLSGVQKGDNIFSATLFANTDKVTKTLPYIKDASIGFSIPDGLIITVHNREPYYSLKSGDDYFLVSEENRILEKIDEKPKGLMFIEAPKLKNADVGGYVKFDKERYTKAVEEIISCLHKNGYEDITGISVKNINDITITYDNRIVIKLGLPDDLDYKIRTAFTIITKNLDPNNAKTITAPRSRTSVRLQSMTARQRRRKRRRRPKPQQLRRPRNPLPRAPRRNTPSLRARITAPTRQTRHTRNIPPTTQATTAPRTTPKLRNRPIIPTLTASIPTITASLITATTASDVKIAKIRYVSRQIFVFK